MFSWATRFEVLSGLQFALLFPEREL